MEKIQKLGEIVDNYMHKLLVLEQHSDIILRWYFLKNAQKNDLNKTQQKVQR